MQFHWQRSDETDVEKTPPSKKERQGRQMFQRPDTSFLFKDAVPGIYDMGYDGGLMRYDT